MATQRRCLHPRPGGRRCTGGAGPRPDARPGDAVAGHGRRRRGLGARQPRGGRGGLRGVGVARAQRHHPPQDRVGGFGPAAGPNPWPAGGGAGHPPRRNAHSRHHRDCPRGVERPRHRRRQPPDCARRRHRRDRPGDGPGPAFGGRVGRRRARLLPRRGGPGRSGPGALDAGVPRGSRRPSDCRWRPRTGPSRHERKRCRRRWQSSTPSRTPTGAAKPMPCTGAASWTPASPRRPETCWSTPRSALPRTPTRCNERCSSNSLTPQARKGKASQQSDSGA